MIKLKIKLDNGIEIKKELTNKQILKIEQSKYFKKLNKTGYKLKCNLYGCKFCKNLQKCKDIKINKLLQLSSYINYLQTI